MIRAQIGAIAFHLPEKILTNDELALMFPEWPASQIEAKIGIKQRHIAADNETSADLAYKAAEKLFASGKCRPEDIDFILLCTESPDYFLPPSSTLLQARLGIPTTCGALDINLACSGYVYTLSLAKGLIESGSAKNVLLLTAETYSKFMHPRDKSVRTVFGDAAAATWVRAVECEPEDMPFIGPFVFGTDGTGGESLIVKTGAMRQVGSLKDHFDSEPDENGQFPDNFLFMDGPSIFSFTLKTVPSAIKKLLSNSSLQMEDINLFVFHQANSFMLESLRKICRIPLERFVVDFVDKGNTVSSTIPIALSEALRKGVQLSNGPLMLVGFGVGLSWAACIIRLPEEL